MRIFGSGTPRLNRDLGYGYMCVSRWTKGPTYSAHLILAITIASRRSSGHCEIDFWVFALLANDGEGKESGNGLRVMIMSVARG